MLRGSGCALRRHIRRRGRTGVRPCAAQRCGRTCFHRQVNQQEGKKRSMKGSFFYLVLRHWHARNLSSSMPPTQGQVGLGEAVLRRGAGARGAIRGTAIAVHRRRNTDPPAMVGQPAVGTP